VAIQIQIFFLIQIQILWAPPSEGVKFKRESQIFGLDLAARARGGGNASGFFFANC
jgi:hypothetical protein